MMPVDYDALFKIAVAIGSGMVGWWLRQMWVAVKELQSVDKQLAEKVSAIEVLVAGTYVTRVELNESFSRLERMLSRIEGKLDGKADK